MSKQFGYDDTELDRPDLNKCPDCGCFFASDYCPLCKKECPEEMRAGNRKAVKPKRVKKSRDSGRVQFISWYHEWWFIVILFLIMPLAGLVVLFTSPHKFRHKILFVVGYLCIPTLISMCIFGGSLLLGGIFNQPLVNDDLSAEEYRQACAEVEPEEYYRSPASYEKAYLKITLTVVSKASVSQEGADNTFYLCQAPGREDFYIIVYNCLIEGDQNFLPGDTVTFYAQYGGTRTVYDEQGQFFSAPSINAAYADVQ